MFQLTSGETQSMKVADSIIPGNELDQGFPNGTAILKHCDYISASFLTLAYVTQAL